MTRWNSRARFALASSAFLFAVACAPGEPQKIEPQAEVRSALDGFTLNAPETVRQPIPKDQDQFGVTVALDDRFLLAATHAPVPNIYEVHVFERSSSWQEVKLLQPTDVETWTWFNAALALSDSQAFVGTGQSDEGGSVLVFDVTTWEQIGRIRPPPTTPKRFGYSVAVSGSTLVVGDPRYGDISSEAGAVHFFERGALEWEYRQTVEAPLVDGPGNFGDAVAIEGDTAVVGDPNSDSRADNGGAVYVFQRSAGVWAANGTLHPATSTADAAFGTVLSLSADTLAIGAPNAGSGQVSVFRRSAGTWSAAGELVPDGTVVDAHGFGISVALDGELLVVGASGAATPSQNGSAWVYYDNGSEFDFAEPLGTGSRADAKRGTSVAAAGSALVVGEPGSPSGSDSGKLDYYTFVKQQLPGAACGGVGDCLSGICVDGICCNAVCDGDCESCSTGQCSPVAAGDPGRCVQDASCDVAAECNAAGECVCLDVGTTCESANECVSGFCVDGLCCDEACDGPCEACSPTGECLAVPEGQPGRCVLDASCDEQPLCSAEGKCVCLATGTSECTADRQSRVDDEGQVVACAPYLCTAGACLDKCSSAADCAPGSQCGADQQCRVPAPATPASSDDGGCSVAGSPRDGAPAGILLLGLGLGLARRQKRWGELGARNGGDALRHFVISEGRDALRPFRCQEARRVATRAK